MSEELSRPGCCDSCDGTGSSLTPETSGQCWDCRGTGHPHDLEESCKGLLLLVRLMDGPGDGAILQLTELPMDIYWQANAGASPYYLRGAIRVAIQALISIHHYRRSFDDRPLPKGIYCGYEYLGLAEREGSGRG